MSEELQETQAAQKPQGQECPVGFQFRFRKLNILSAAGVLAGALIVALCFPALFSGEGGAFQADAFFWGYLGLSLLGALLCLCEVGLPEAAQRVVGWILTLLLPLGAFFAVDLINGTRILTFSPLRGFANYLCYLMVFALLYALSRRVWVTALAGGILFLFFGCVNYFVIQFRGSPILPLDLQSLTTAAEVSGGYRYVPTRAMAISFLGLVCTVLLCLKLGPKGLGKTKRASRLIERLCALIIAGTLCVLIFPCDLLTAMGVSVWPWNQKVSSEITGVMAGFFGNVQFMMVEKPEGYSAEKIQELTEGLNLIDEPDPLGDPAQQPTIIVVMNESMTDFMNTGDVELSQDNLPFLHSLQDSGDVIWGMAYSSVFGGNTCNSEYEFLTGNTTAFLPTGSIPYQQYVTHSQTALPSILKSYGYSCTAIHPGNREAWQRDKAYPNLGFDEFISAKDFDVRREIVHGLTSDESCYDQIIYEYEHRDKDTPQFIFNVTIQNHGGFEDEDVPVTVQVKNHEGKWPQAEQYLSLTKLSDKALEGLVGYFEQQEDPVVILFFGDHWPNLENGFVSELLGTDASDMSFEDLIQEYQVPFLIWANYPLEGQYVENISLNYLSGLLLRAANLPGTDYTRFLESLRQNIPAINALGFIDREGNLYQNGDETPFDEILNEYAILQYNNAFGGEEKLSELFLP